MKYPIEKYNIIVHQHPQYGGVEIIAYSTYAGKIVRGKAICHVDDNYNEEKGKRLAVARCAAKIARKREARAVSLLRKAENQLCQAQKYVADMKKYALDASAEVSETAFELRKILIDM